MIIDEHPGDPAGLALSADFSEKWLIEGIPAKSWHPASKTWHLPVMPNVEYLRRNFTKKDFTPAAIDRIRNIVENQTLPVEFTGSYPGTPMEHQKKALDRAAGKTSFMFAHAMGTGKTYTILTLASHLYRIGHIKQLLVLCPATLRRDVWDVQIPQWLDGFVDYDYRIVEGHYNVIERWLREPKDGLKILVAGVEVMSRSDSTAYGLVKQFLSLQDTAMYVDESHRIKTPGTGRTKNIIELGGYAKYRWAGTGTKITQGIHDLYSQFRYMDWSIIGQKSFYTFKARYCQMGGFEGRKIIGYTNVRELLHLIAPYTDVVRKEDANDLPPKVYLTRHVKASDEQKRLYTELTDYMEASDGDDVLEVSTILARMTRYQQIAGGSFPYQLDGEWTTRPLKKNPKLEALMGILEDTDESVIVWARFIPEIQTIIQWLRHAYGEDSTVAYYGAIPKADRKIAIDRFQGKEARFFVANQASAGLGLTLTAATIEVYFSNSFSLGDREQSEDRAHRTGQTNKVTIIDILSDLKIDSHIQKSILSKRSMATYVADELRNRT